MDIQNLTNVSTVVINSLLMLLKDNHVDVNSVVMQLSNNKDEAISPEVNLGELTQQTLDELQKAKAQKVAVPEGFVVVPKEIPKSFDEGLYFYSNSISVVNEHSDGFIPMSDIDHSEIWKLVIEAQEQANDLNSRNRKRLC